VESWFDDETDTELDDLIPFLKELSKVDNVRTYLEARKRDGKLIYK
jgi:TFIIF-interacting CTD phosphatase-like protein